MNIALKKIAFISFLIFITNSRCHEITYVSQYGQDKYCHTLFSEKTDGTYVEIGAHNGIKFSNTYIFQQLGWRGMCIEPIPEVYNELCKNRNSNCICIRGCIADFSGEAQFLHVVGHCEMLSGLTQKYDPRHVNRIRMEATANRDTLALHTVMCYKLNDLLTLYSFFHVDILTIDTEGGELDILRSIDFDTFDIDILCVEDNYDLKNDMCSHLEKHNFNLITTIGCDLIFRNKKYLNQ
jgi:FkbM family methyltransferase